jgi:hypothetical protein
MTSAAQRWDAELDRLDASLHAAEEALASGEDADSVAGLLAAEPPPDMPALPTSHRERAEATLGRINALTALLTDRLAALGTTIARSHRPAASAPEAATARFIDQAV